MTLVAEPPDQAALIALAEQLREAAGTVPLLVLGGVAIALRAPDAAAPLRRASEDLDVAAPRRARREIEDAFGAAGLEGEREFNALQGSRRQIWWTPDRATHVDVFLGEFAMCHTLDLDGRLDVPHAALPAADLLLMKLQVVHLNLKDVQDLAALLTTHALGEGDGEGVIDRGRLHDVLGADWGFYTTAGDNLERLGDLVAEHAPEAEPRVREQSAALREELEAAPKTRAFRMRAKVGRRRRWYELPEESL
jgi:hypothetical protein